MTGEGLPAEYESLFAIEAVFAWDAGAMQACRTRRSISMSRTTPGS